LRVILYTECSVFREVVHLPGTVAIVSNWRFDDTMLWIRGLNRPEALCRTLQDEYRRDARENRREK
jgi:hypothetical protein